MSYLLFMDESGTDHKKCPYEVRGGVAIHSRDLWYFIKRVAYWENQCYGTHLHFYKSELKGDKLLSKRRIKFSQQEDMLDDEARRKLCRSFLEKGKAKDPNVSRLEMTAYGQAGVLFIKGLLYNLKLVDASLFAAIIPRNPPEARYPSADHFLRKDHVFLFERFSRFLEEKQEDGVVVMDEVDKTGDRRFVHKMTQYFTKTEKGKERAKFIVPSPLFVSSDMAYPIQAADICIYCINHVYRFGSMKADVREELSGFIPGLRCLTKQFPQKWGPPMYSVVYVPDPNNPSG